MNEEALQNLLKEVQDKIKSQGMVVDARLLEKEKQLKKMLSEYQ